jgi:hypothetical protein
MSNRYLGSFQVAKDAELLRLSLRRPQVSAQRLFNTKTEPVFLFCSRMQHPQGIANGPASLSVLVYLKGNVGANESTRKRL